LIKLYRTAFLTTAVIGRIIVHRTAIDLVFYFPDDANACCLAYRPQSRSWVERRIQYNCMEKWKTVARFYG